MLIHHDSRDYNVAASEAAKLARSKFEAMIARGTGPARETVEHVLSTIPKDSVVRAGALDFRPRPTTAPGGMRLIPRTVNIGWGRRTAMPLHHNALKQVSEKFGISGHYVNKLLKAPSPDEAEWRQSLLCHNLRELAAHQGKDRRFLVRSISTNDDLEVRGILSDKYRRMDSRPILDAFLGAAQRFGAVPCEGTVTDTKVYLRLVLPHIFEPVPNEPTCFGIQFQNSDFGNGKLEVRGFLLRLACTNKAVTEESLSQVHLGRRLDDNITFSDKTYQLDTQAMASAVKDIVSQVLEPDAVHLRLDQLRAADERKIASFNQLGALKSALSKEEWASVKSAFEGPDEYNLPPGKSVYRLSNAISWIAHTVEDKDRAHELEALAGSTMALGAAPRKAA